MEGGGTYSFRATTRKVPYLGVGTCLMVEHQLYHSETLQTWEYDSFEVHVTNLQ